MGHSPAVLGQDRGLGVKDPFDQTGSRTAVAVPVLVVGSRNGSDRTDEIQLPCMVAPVELGNNGMILIEIGLGAAERGIIGRDEGSIQPLIGMQQYGQHAVGVGAVQDLLVNLGFSLARKNLADIGNARESFMTLFRRTYRIKGFYGCRSLAQSCSGQINRRF